MRFISPPAIGLILVVVGIALVVPNSIHFTSESAVNERLLGFDRSWPETIFLNPVVGGISLAAGLVLLFLEFRDTAH